MTLTKTINIDDDALEVIGAMDWEEDGNTVIGKIAGGQLERKLYLSVNKGLDALGGKWNRSKQGHVFKVDPRQRIHDMLNTGTVIVARDGYFPTPLEIGRRMAEYAYLNDGEFVLEPSAGTGELAQAILEVNPNVNLFCVELNEERRQVLVDKGLSLYPSIANDFLKVWADGTDFSKIIMNPPFENMQDINHVRHAYLLLAPGGILVSVMSNSPFFREDQKAKDFRDWLDTVPHKVYHLPEGAFKESGTMIATNIVTILKEE